MDCEETVLHNAFALVCEGFGKNHARVYWSLINFPSQSVVQLEQRLHLGHCTLYPLLNDLLTKGLIWFTKTRPKYFNAKPAINAFKELQTQKTNQILQRLDNAYSEIQKIIQNASAQSGEEYLIKIHQGQTRLFNPKTNEPIQEIEPIFQIKKGLEGQLQKEREKQWQTSQGCRLNSPISK